MSEVSLPVTDNEGYVDSFDVIMLDDTLMTVYRRTDVTFTEDSFETASDLCVQYKDNVPELKITDIRYDEYDLFNDNTITLTVSVSNFGMADAEGFTLQIGNSEAVYFDMPVLSGGSVEAEIDYTLSEADTVETEVLLSDNAEVYSTSSVMLRYADFMAAVETKILSGNSHANITVRNTGNMTGTGILTVFRNDADGEVLYTENITLSDGAQRYILLGILDETLDKVFVEVLTEDNEYYTGDNTDYCTVYRTQSEDDSADINGDGVFDETDALYLLRHTFLPERYPLFTEDADYDGNGIINAKDAVYLLTQIQ